MILPLLISIFLTSAFWVVFFIIKKSSFTHLANEILQKAEKDAKVLEVKTKYELEKSNQKELFHLTREKEKLKEEEKKLVTSKKALQEEKQLFAKKQKALKEKEEALYAKEKEICTKLSEISTLTKEEAEAQFMATLTKERLKESALFLEKSQEEMVERAQVEASRVISLALGNVAQERLSEMTIVPITLLSDDMKGRLIGREGKNIRLFETLTGINLIIDETPKTVYLSGFDEERKEVAKIAIKQLLKEGRIHPTRIEEVVSNAKEAVAKSIPTKGKELAMKAHIYDLHPKLITLLGKLHFRYSLGQNVANHSLEVCQIMSSFAHELGVDDRLARRIGLLHDIGKAVADSEKSHALTGHDLALGYGESTFVANGIGCHHNEMSPTSVEASLISLADMLSSARLGARNANSAKYYTRLKELEKICLTFAGVEKAFALQAGREVRLVVAPERIGDAEMTHLAKAVADKIESTLSFGGNIKVTLVREQKTISWAK